MPPTVEARSLNHWTAREVPPQFNQMKKFGDAQNWRCWEMGNLQTVGWKGHPLVEPLERASRQHLLKHCVLFFFNNKIFLLISYQTCLSKLFPHILCLCTLFLYTFIYLYFLFLAALGLCCCVQAFSSCGEQGLLFVAVRRLLTAVASLVEEHGL